MPTIRVDIESRNEASRQVRDLRERMIELNRTIAENRNRLVGANAEEAKRIRALNQANSALKANISVEMQELRLKQQIINETNREARARETAARAAARQAEQSRQAARELGTGIAATSGLAARQLGQLTVGFVQAASEMETFRNTIQAVTRDAGETDRILQRLLEVSVDLVGIDTGDLIQFSGRLMAVGLTSEEAITAITGVTERIAEQGRPAHETAAALEQVAQSLNSGRARMDDFRPLLRVFPTFWQDVTNALGENVRSTEDFNRVAEASGGHTQTLLRVLTEMARASEGADLSTLNSQLDILNDQSRVLQAELGQHLIPAIVSIVMQINEWIEAFNDLDDDAQAAIAWGAALATGLTALTAVISGTVVAVGALSASLSAITGTAGLGGVATLAGQAAGSLGRVVSILGRLGAAGNLAATAGITLAQAWNQIYNDFQRTAPFEDAVESITTFNVAASETARSLGLTAESLSGLSQEARTEIELLTERADQLRTSIRNAINRGDTEGARAFREEYRQVNTELQGLITTLPQVATETEAVTESLAEQFVRSADQVIRLRDAFRTVSEGDDIQAIETAASNLTSALESELSLQLMDAELTAADRLDLELSTARAIEGVNRDAQQRISRISQDRSDEEVAAAERQRDARIAAAERARAAEVAGHERARDAGASYAEQLAMIASVAQRRAFVAIVERLQDQGLSLDEARERAAQFIPILATLATGVNTADHAFGNFSSTLVRDADLSADAVANLTRNVLALGAAIDESLQTDQTFIGFGRDITGRATGTTIDSDQAAAGQAGRAFVNRLRERQARAANQRLQRGLSEIQNYAVAVSDVLGSIDNDYADLTSRMAENTASFVRLASGDFTALADVALNVIDFIQDREAHLHEVRMRQAAERLAFETEAAERIRSANTIANALGVDPNQFLTPGQARFSPGQRGGELGELGLIAPLTTLPTLDLQAIVDSAPDISTGLTGALEQQLTSAIAVAFANGEPVIEAFQPFFAHLETAMDRAGAAFDTALQGAADPSEIQYRFETLVSETTEFYDLQIRAVQAAATQSGNTARQATFELIQERDNIINEATNALRNASSGTGRFAAFQRAQNYQQRIATNRTPADIDAEYLATFTPGDPIADLPIRGGIEAAQGISDLDISNLQVQADEAIDIFRQAITAPARTIESINEAFATLEPQLRTLYESIREQIIGPDGIISDAEQIQLNDLGTFTEFISQWTGLRDTAIAGVMQAQQRLAVTSQQIATSNAISDFGELVNAPGQTIESLTEAWETNVIPFLNGLYDKLFAQIAGPDGFINTTEETTAFLQLGSREDFIGDYENRILNPALTSFQTVQQNIAQLLQGQELDTTLQGFNDAILAPGQTIEGLTTYWDTHVVPELRETYNGLRNQIIGEDGVISPTELQTLIQRGLNVPFEDWVGQYEDGVLTPGINRLQSAAQVIASITQSRAQTDIIKMFNAAIEAPGQTIEGLNTFWIDNVVPVLRTTYNQSRAEVIGEDGIISPEEAAELTRRGLDIPFEDWVSPYEQNILTPGIQRLMGAAQVITNITQGRAQTDIIKMFNAAATAPGATIESINMFWDDNVVPVLRTTYNSLRAEIIGEDGLISPSEAAELARRGLDIPFEDWDDQFETGIRDPALTNLRGAISVIASITQQTAQSNVFEMFKGALEAPGATIESVTTFWNENVTPVLRTTYNSLRAEIIGEDGLISPSELAELTRRGLNVPFEDWESNFRDDILTPGIDSLTASTNIITGVTNNRQLDGVITGFNSALEAPGATVAGVTQYWIDNVDPVLMEVYNFERGLIIGEDGLISPSEAARLAQAGLDLPFTDWSQQYKDDIFTPGITKLEETLTSIGLLTQGNMLTGVIAGFNTAAEAPGATVAGLTTYWQDNVDPVLLAVYTAQRNAIIGTDGLISPSELQQLIQAGLNVPFEDWAGQYEMDIRDPAIQTLKDATAVIEGVTQTNAQSDVIQMFNDAVKAPGATIEGITTFWTENVTPVLRNTYNGLRSAIIGEDGLISPTELAELTRQGLNVPFEDWAGQFKTDIFDPGVAFIEGEAEYLESTELQTGVDTAIENWKAQVEAPGATLAGLTEAWNTNVVPALRNLYADLLDDIEGPDGIINTARERADLLQLGTEEDFIAGFGSDIFTPVTQAFQSQQQGAARRAGRFNIRQARFNLGGATSEGEFDTLFGVLQTAVNDFYDGEERRIRALGLSVQETNALIEENNLNRQQELRGLERITNTFAEDRIDTEMRVQMEIEDLREEAFENERDRIARLAKLNEDHQARLADIEMRRLQGVEDSQRGFERSLEDVLRGAGVDESFFLSGDFQRVFATAQSTDQSGLREFLPELGIDLSESEFNQIQEAALRRRREQEDDSVQARRQRDRAETGFTRSRDEIAAEAIATGNAVHNALAPLLRTLSEQEQMSPTAELESATATTASETAMTEATTAMTASETAMTEAGTALIQSGVADLFSTAVPTFATAADTFLEGSTVFREEVALLGAALTRLSSTRSGRRALRGAANENAGGMGGIPGEPDNRLFHFPQTDAILRQVVAREAAALQPRDYLPSFEQVRNAVDLSHHAAQGFIEGVRRNDGLSGDTQGGGVPDEMRADITLNFGDGTVAKLRDQVVRLKQNRRTL